MAWPRWTGFRNKTVWDFLQLLIVPLMLVAIGFWFTAQQDARQHAIEKQSAERLQKVEEQRAQDLTLQAYLDQMSTLVLEDLGDTKVRTLARARTLTVLRRLDPSRKEEIMQFLLEADLVTPMDKSKPVIELNGAALSGTDLSGADLSGADLRSANLSNADLNGANLRSALLQKADLNGANLRSALLQKADLSGADLSDANLRSANLSNADLSSANLSNADPVDMMSGADLSGVDLSNANLGITQGSPVGGAEGWTERQLSAAKSLEGATMPDGQTLKGPLTPDGPTFEDWIKDKKARK